MADEHMTDEAFITTHRTGLADARAGGAEYITTTAADFARLIALASTADTILRGLRLACTGLGPTTRFLR